MLYTVECWSDTCTFIWTDKVFFWPPIFKPFGLELSVSVCSLLLFLTAHSFSALYQMHCVNITINESVWRWRSMWSFILYQKHISLTSVSIEQQTYSYGQGTFPSRQTPQTQKTVEFWPLFSLYLKRSSLHFRFDRVEKSVCPPITQAHPPKLFIYLLSTISRLLHCVPVCRRKSNCVSWHFLKRL